MSLTASNYSADAFVTAANPAPGRDLVFEYPLRSGAQWDVAFATRSDGGIGLNTYLAGGAGVSGSVPVYVLNQSSGSSGGNVNITASVTLPVSQTNTPAGTQIVQVSGSVTGNITVVSVSMTGIQLLAANNLRKGATVTNYSSNILYLALGPTASNSIFTLPIATSGYYETPFNYNGSIYGVCDVSSTTGNWLVTELS